MTLGLLSTQNKFCNKKVADKYHDSVFYYVGTTLKVAAMKYYTNYINFLDIQRTYFTNEVIVM